MNKYTITSIMILLSSSSLAQDSCMVRPSCADMGYTKSATDCEGKKAISCPFDTTAYYCPEVGESCDFSEYPLTECPTGGNCTEFECGGTTQYKLDSCQNSYEISSDGLTCNACNFTNYPLSTCDANGTCSNYTCGNVTKYKLDSCNSGYNKSGNTCVVACSLSGYPLTSCPANGNCTSKTCSGTTKYKLNSCKSGYNKSGNTCVYACSGYYECGGDWQYCEGYTCSADSDMCSEYCVDDYFPYSCDSESLCDDAWGVYRDGYCSESCECFPDNCSNYPFEDIVFEYKKLLEQKNLIEKKLAILPRGYISKNTKEVSKAYNCFQELKKYAKDLKQVLK